MTYRPDVSVIIVSNARPDSLALTLKALEYQRYRNFEVIVVSDVPAARRPATDLYARWIAFEERNISAARNRGLVAARGEIIAFIDDDAVPEFGWLGALISPFETDRVGAAGGFVRGRNGVSFQWKASLFDRLGADHPIDVPDGITIFPPDTNRFLKTTGTNCAFRRGALVDVGGFDAAYRFFLDETDLNLRLSQAGWHAAINPAAEVLHGFAEGPHRTARRVPTSLFEIGASLACFLHRHAPKADHADRLSQFRAEQRARLLRHHSVGLLDGTSVRALMASLERGYQDGPKRAPDTLAIRDWGTGKFPPPRPRETPERLCIALPLLGGAAAMARAQEAAAARHEVTVLAPELSTRALTVNFTSDGYFLHRFGLAGKSERGNPRRLRSVTDRIEAERRRIADQRDVDQVLKINSLG
ncbi:MAG: glycosyltransferase [Pseudomonadota bacterium]